MKYFIRLFVASLFIASCFAPPVQTDISSQIPTVVAPTPNYTSNNQSSYNDRNNNNNNDNNNSDTCEDDNDCEDICDDIFNNRGDKNDCKEDLSVSVVEDMEEAYDIIKEADEDDLDDLNISDLEEIMDISIEPIVDLLDGYRSSEAKEFLVWLFDEDNEEALDLFKDKDEDYEMLEAALQNLDSDVIEALGIKIDGGDDIFEYLSKQDHEEGLEWIHDFFADGTGKNKNGVCNDDRCTFDKYCRVLNKGFKSTRDREGIFGFGYFEEFMEDLLSEADFEKLKKGEDYEDFCNTRLNYRLDSTKSDSNTSNTSVGSCDKDTITAKYESKAFFFKFATDAEAKAGISFAATGKRLTAAALATGGYCSGRFSACVNGRTNLMKTGVAGLFGIKHLTEFKKHASRTDFILTFSSKNKIKYVTDVFILVPSGTNEWVRATEYYNQDSDAITYYNSNEYAIRFIPPTRDTITDDAFKVIIVTKTDAKGCNPLTVKITN